MSRMDGRFWMITMVRGFSALFAGIIVLIAADSARWLLLMPIAVAVSVAALAFYGILDNLLVVTSSFIVKSARLRASLAIQGALGVCFGVLLLSLLFDRADLNWFLPLAMLQAGSTAVWEIVILYQDRNRRWAIYDLASAFVAAAATGGYALVRHATGVDLSARETSMMVFGFLACFGLAQIFTAVRILRSRRSAVDKPIANPILHLLPKRG
jgi:hypothetical protein